MVDSALQYHPEPVLGAGYECLRIFNLGFLVGNQSFTLYKPL